MTKTFAVSFLSLVCCLAVFGREKAILDGNSYRLEGKKYPVGVTPTDAIFVISPILSVTMFEDMNPADRQLLARAYSQDPETASLVVAAQIGVYCWQRGKKEDQQRSQYFIASSLYRLWRHDDSVALFWYDEAQKKPVSFNVGYLFDAYTFLYGVSAEKTKSWLENVVRKIPDRNGWAVIAVEEILNKKDITVSDLSRLISITRNMYVGKTQDIEAFKKWWEKMKGKSRRDWAIDLVDRSIKIVTGKQPATHIEGEAALHQLSTLLPEEMWVKTLGQPVPTTDREKKLQKALNELESWWESHKKEYTVPLDSSLAL